jgi:DNA processing protein
MQVSHLKNIPERLKQMADPPAELFTHGAELNTLLAKPCLAVVGSRACSPYGRQVTEQLVQAVARAGVVIISGLALGIDSIAHRAALEAGGLTIAVLPNSVERVYPAGHRQLAEQIINRGGALVSEFQERTSPMKHQFIGRNRLISGLSDAVLLTEAAERSGSLHTAQFALETGREVFAVPGNITSPGSAGVNNLIKTSANPITSPKDLLDYFGLQKPKQAILVGGSKEEQAILDLMQQGITAGSELLAKSGVTAVQYNQALTMLEITGGIKPLGNDHWSLT